MICFNNNKSTVPELSVDLLWTATSPLKRLYYCKIMQTVIEESIFKLSDMKGNLINLFYSTYMKWCRVLSHNKNHYVHIVISWQGVIYINKQSKHALMQDAVTACIVLALVHRSMCLNTEVNSSCVCFFPRFKYPLPQESTTVKFIHVPSSNRKR